MQARLAELEVSLASSKEAEANAQTELETVRAKAAQLGSAMQSRVVAAETETESCRNELQAAMRDQEDRHAKHINGLKDQLQEMQAEAAAKVAADANTHAELSALRGVDSALKEVILFCPLLFGHIPFVMDLVCPGHTELSLPVSVGSLLLLPEIGGGTRE